MNYLHLNLCNVKRQAVEVMCTRLINKMCKCRFTMELTELVNNKA